MRPIKISLLLTLLALSLIACQPLNPSPGPLPDGGQPDDGASDGSLPRATGYACVPQNTMRQYARLVKVVDGDTIEVEMEGQQYRVRYIGVDTPERDTNFYQEATEANQALLAGEFLLLVTDVSDTDQYGRLLRYVFAGQDSFVNYELVKGGYAFSATFPPDVACADAFLDAQIEAREQGAGLWGATRDTPAAAVVIDLIHYDGQATPVETDEFVLIKNTGPAPVEVTGWQIDAGSSGQLFTFPAFTLQAGQSCRVYTNEFHPETCGFSFGLNESIWSNSGECGYLYDSQGLLVDALCYE